MANEPLLAVEGVSKSYRVGRPALHDVSFQLERARTLALVGPSGSGKSTMARGLAFFDPPDSGEIRLEGRRLAHLTPQIQLILQEPSAALHPRFTAGEVIEEPLVIGGAGGSAEHRARARRALEAAGIPASEAGRKAIDFSGGERQRLAIARALVIEPKLMILDESLSGLDLSIRALVVNLLLDAQERTGVALILISHDLNMVAQWADEIAVMDGGTIVEHADTASVMNSPRHATTRALVAASRELAGVR